MRLHSVMIATFALAFGGVMQASAAAPEAQAAAAPTKSATAAAAAPVKSEKTTSAYRLMTPDERKAFRQKVQSLKTPKEREAFRLEHHKLMEKRAEERGEKLRPMLTREDMQARAAAHKKKVQAQSKKDPASADEHPAQ